MLLALALTAQALTFTAAPIAQDAPPGWLGVGLDVEDGRARPLLVTQVEDGAPAARGGVRAGDRLVGLAGHELDSYDELIGLLREFGPGAEVPVTVHRVLEVELDGRGWGEPDGPRLGVHLGMASGENGARWVIRKAEPGWPAARGGVRDGDRLVEVAGREPADFDELQAVLAKVAPDGELRLLVERDLMVRLGSRPGETQPEPEAWSGRFVPPGRYELEPDGQGRMRLTPRGAQPEPRGELYFGTPRADSGDLERQLREEISGLNKELRALREELATLRRELAALRDR